MSDVKALTNHGYGMEDEAMRVIKNGPDWLPAIQNGKKVTAYRKQPINFIAGKAKKNSALFSSPETSGYNREVVAVSYRKVEHIDSLPKEKIEIHPYFPGGSTAWNKYLERNVDAMTPVKNGAPKGSYTVIIQYIVNEDGSISDVKALTNHGYGMEAEGIRLLKGSPNWRPAIVDGKKVGSYRKQPLTFIVEEEKNVKTIENKLPAITLADLKTITPHTLLKLSKEISIVSYTYTTDDDKGSVHESPNTGESFSTRTKELIQTATKDRIITIDNIRGIKNGKETKFPSLVYQVI